MQDSQIYKTLEIVLAEPIYLTIFILLILAFIYSVLKKFFKLLIITLISLLCYLGYLIFTNQDLPGETEHIIYPLIDSAKEKATEIIDGISK